MRWRDKYLGIESRTVTLDESEIDTLILEHLIAKGVASREQTRRSEVTYLSDDDDSPVVHLVAKIVIEFSRKEEDREGDTP